jgi:hypothetical protein
LRIAIQRALEDHQEWLVVVALTAILKSLIMKNRKIFIDEKNDSRKTKYES